MAVYNTQQKIDIYVHATKMSKSNNDATKSVNPSKKKEETNGYVDDSQISSPISHKRAIHQAQNVVRFISNMSVNVLPTMTINQISNSACDVNYQASMRRKQELVQDIANPVTSITNSTLSGAMIAGPVGALVGLVTSSVGSIVSLANKYESRNIDYAVKIWKEEQSVNYNKARAGIDLTDGRSRLR